MKRNLCCQIACLAIVLGCFSCGYVRAQDSLPRRVMSESDEYHVKRNVPQGFRLMEDNKALIFDTCWNLRRDLGGIWKKSKVRTAVIGVLLQSDDKQCEVIYNDIIDLQFYRRPNVLTYRGIYLEQKWGHRGAILAILMAQFNRSDLDFDYYVTVTSGREARRRFNADSVFVFEVPIEPQHWDGEVYTHCISMYLSRKNRAYLGFVWLFTDEGYKRRQQYMDALEGNVAYKKGCWRKPEWIRKMEKAERMYIDCPDGNLLHRKEKQFYPAAAQIEISNKKLSYLQFKKGFTGSVNELSDRKNKAIFFKALDRAKIAKKDGIWQMEATSARQLNVSPEIFMCLKELIENSNYLDRKHGQKSGAGRTNKIMLR